jgi:hypothetical protein
MNKFFTLLCATLIVGTSLNAQLYSEDFEGGAIPAGWVNTSIATDGGFSVGTDGSSFSAPIPTNGGNYAYTNDDDCNCDKSGESLQTDVISVPATGTYLLSFDYWFFNGDYQGDDETAGLSISTDGGTSWTAEFDFAGSAEWQTAQLILDDYSGMDINLLFTYDDGGGWNYAYAIDNVLIDVLPAIVVENVATLIPEIYTTENGGLAINALLNNQGGDAITDVTFNYQVDDEAVVSETVSGLDIAPFASEVVTHPTLYVAGSLGDKNIVTWFTDINSSTEQSGLTEASVQLVDQHVEGFAFSETCTSNTCGPCANFNPPYTTVLENLDANGMTSNIIAIKYQADYPLPSSDVCYNPDSDTRIAYYGYPGIPATFIQGRTPQSEDLTNAFTWQEYAEAHGTYMTDIAMDDAFIGVEANATINDGAVSVSVTVTPKAQFDAGEVLHVAIINNEYTDSELSVAPTNGEGDFNRVMRKMLPDANGTDLGALEIDVPQTYTFDYDVTVGDPAQSNYNLVNDDISLVVFVQNESTSQVRMAVSAEISDVTSVSENELASAIQIGPNPVNDILNVRIALENQENVSIEILNAVGQRVYIESLGSLNALSLRQIDMSSFDAGIYHVNVIAGNTSSSTKVSLIK